MQFSLTSNRINVILLVLLLLFGLGSFAYNQFLIERISAKERSSVELWAKATEFTGDMAQEEASRNLLKAVRRLRQNPSVPDSILALIETATANRSSDNFVIEEIITKRRFEIPTIIVNESGQILSGNYIEGELNDERLKEFAEINAPLKIRFGTDENPQTQFVYYGESPTVQYLRYFPYIQFSLLALVLGMAFLSYRTISKSEQSNIWVGMTREAAHQLGTPLSSMYGWIGLLREERKDDVFAQRVASELENDVTRLRGVAERFNKIGSEPELESQNIAPQIDVVIDYMERRVPQLGKKVEIRRSIEPGVRAKINPELFQWGLENVIKNSMNAIKSTRKGAFVSVSLQRVENKLHIDIEDSGRGIEKKYHKEIFKPGYSTKKRGWGLGLSLTKRIIEEYHKGKIMVVSSEVGKGTTMRIILQADPAKKE
jgi:signal transduction histidine kinase